MRAGLDTRSVFRQLNNFYRTQPNTQKPAAGLKPDWGIIPHKNMSALSKDEIFARVRELAVQDAAIKGDRSKEQERKMQELFAMHVSSVSPDRKVLYKNALETVKQVGGVNNGNQEPKISKKDIFDFITEKKLREHGKGMEYGKSYNFSGGGAVSTIIHSGKGVGFGITHGSHKVLGIEPNGSVYYQLTPAEEKAREEISNFYINALVNARRTSQKVKSFDVFDYIIESDMRKAGKSVEIDENGKLVIHGGTDSKEAGTPPNPENVNSDTGKDYMDIKA
jgi:hypothetical protein